MMQAPENFRVEITQEGRGGSIVYHEDHHEFSVWWEFAGGNRVVAYIAVPPPDYWDHQVSWAVGRRDEILTRIASEVIRQKASSSFYSIEDQFIDILSSSVPPTA